VDWTGNSGGAESSGEQKSTPDSMTSLLREVHKNLSTKNQQGITEIK